MAFEAQPNIAGLPFRDLRSARRASNRSRKHAARYNNFHQISPSDLPSHENQTSHYLPTCAYSGCPSYDTVDTCHWSTFPADLSTAPTAKFTKREAYDEVKRWKGHAPRHHNKSREPKNSPKWEKQKGVKRGMVDELHPVKGEWVSDLDWMRYEDEMFEMYCHLEWDDDFWYYFDEDEDEEEDEGYQSETEAESNRELCANGVEWNWHRSYQSGDWFAAKWRCQEFWCVCGDEQAERWRKAEEEREMQEEWWANPMETWDIWLAKGEGESEKAIPVEADWDMVSTASEAWTEVIEHDSDFESW